MKVRIKNKKKFLLIISFLIVTAIVIVYSWHSMGKYTREFDYRILIEMKNATEYDMLVAIFPIAMSQGKIIEVSTRSNQTSRRTGDLTSPLEETTYSVVPSVTSSKEVVKRGGIEQLRLEKNSYEFVSYYLGEEVDFQSIIVCVIAWKTYGNLDFSVFQEEPYFVQTFYKPEFKVGPDEYGAFASLTIE